MAINRVEIKDFLVFKGDFSADFCPGVNVSIGSNATGKTTLLKVMYNYLRLVESDSLPKETQSAITKEYKLYRNNVKIDIGEDIFRNAIYIPEKDILEHARGLLTFIDQKDTDFSTVYRDVLITAQDVNTKEQSETQKTVSDIITAKIGGKVEWVPSEGRYYTVRADGTRIPFSNEASGFKKLGYLELLVRTGHLEPGSVLFWDEPENSLNPELVPVLVDILLELSRNGVQIFVATHSDFLCKWLELKTSGSNCTEIKFFSLYKEGIGISAETSKSYRSLTHNSIIEQSVELYNEHLRRATEHDED